MQDAGSWLKDTAFTKLDDRAAELDGSGMGTDLWTNWSAALSLHAPYYY